MTENRAKSIDDCLKELRGHRDEYLKRSTPWRIINRAVHLVEELKAYRAIGTIEELQALKENSFFNFESPIVRVDEKSYNKAIEDFTEALRLKCIEDTYNDVHLSQVFKIAELLKGGAK